MSDHAFLGLLVILTAAMGIGGLLVTMSMLREAQGLTRAVAAMVYQESEKTRSALGSRPPA